MMIDYIRGRLSQLKSDKMIVEAGGIGYSAFISNATHASLLPCLGSEVTIYMATMIREDSHNTYGFLQEIERELFLLLNEISGIGPRIALSILGFLPPFELYETVHQSNIEALCQIPGIGKKMGEKLLLELRNRFEKFSKQYPTYFLSAKAKREKEEDPSGPLRSDAIKALIHLGYAPLQAQQAVKKAAETAKKGSLSELISLALKTKNEYP